MMRENKQINNRIVYSKCESECECKVYQCWIDGVFSIWDREDSVY